MLRRLEAGIDGVILCKIGLSGVPVAAHVSRWQYCDVRIETKAVWILEKGSGGAHRDARNEDLTPRSRWRSWACRRDCEPAWSSYRFTAFSRRTWRDWWGLSACRL